MIDDQQEPIAIDQESTKNRPVKTNKIISFAQRLINSNRKPRERSYTTPVRPINVHATLAKEERQSSLANGLFDRLKLNNNGGNGMRTLQPNTTDSWASTSEFSSPSSIANSPPPDRFDSPEYPLGPAQRQFCVQHLTKQIQTLQRTLQQQDSRPTESTLHDSATDLTLSTPLENQGIRPDESEDTLALAIAELKKIRDVLEGSLTLDNVVDTLDNVEQTAKLQMFQSSEDQIGHLRSIDWCNEKTSLMASTSSSSPPLSSSPPAPAREPRPSPFTPINREKNKFDRDSGEFAKLHTTMQD